MRLTMGRSGASVERSSIVVVKACLHIFIYADVSDPEYLQRRDVECEQCLASTSTEAR